MSHARSALALALGWALLELRHGEALNPLRRQPITHDPRIRRALGATQDANDFGNSDPLALAYKAHAGIQKEKCTMCKKRLAHRCTVCSLIHMNLTDTIKEARRIRSSKNLPAIVTENRLSRKARKTWFSFRFAVNESMEIGREIVNDDGSISIIREVIA